MSKKPTKKSKFSGKQALELVQAITTAPKNPIDRSKIPSLGSFIRKIKKKSMAAGRKNMFPMPYMVDEDPKTGKFKYKPKSMKKGDMADKVLNPNVANKVVDKIVKSKKYSYVNRAMNPKSPTIGNQTMKTMGADGKLFPTIRRNKRGRLRQYDSKQALKMSQLKKDAIPVTDIAPTYVSTKDVSLALSNRVAKSRGMKKGGTNSSCPYRENGVRSPIKGIKPLQIKGVKFTGVK